MRRAISVGVVLFAGMLAVACGGNGGQVDAGNDVRDATVHDTVEPSDIPDAADVMDIADVADTSDLAPADAPTDAGDAFCTIEDTIVNGPDCPEPPPFFEGVDVGDFQTCPGDELSQITPGTPVTYMELRRCFGGATSEDCYVVSSWGSKCADAIDQAACTTEFDALHATWGFGEGCLPAFCYHYLVVNRADSNFLVGTPDAIGVVEFLAPLETFSDVQFILEWLGGMNLHSEDPAISGYREVDGGWEVIGTMLHQGCDPITDDRLLIHVNPDGTWTVICRQLYSVLCGACI